MSTLALIHGLVLLFNGLIVDGEQLSPLAEGHPLIVFQPVKAVAVHPVGGQQKIFLWDKLIHEKIGAQCRPGRNLLAPFG